MEKVIKILFWLGALCSPVKAIIITMVFLIIVDFITGAYAAYKKQIPIRSHRIMHTISKFVIYNLVILAAFFLEEYIVSEVPFLKIIAGFIAITEIKSILENFDKIYGVNPFKALINLLKNTPLKDTLESLGDDKSQIKKP